MKKIYHIYDASGELIAIAELPIDRTSSNLIFIAPSEDHSIIPLCTGRISSASSLSDIEIIKQTLEQNDISPSEFKIVEGS